MLRVTFDFPADAATVAAWKDCLEQASKMLHHATEGTVRIAEVVYANDGAGGEEADAFVSKVDGSSYFSSDHLTKPGGFFGDPSASMTIATSNVDDPFIVLHELGHYAFGLGDEYLDWDPNTRCASNQQRAKTPDGAGARACIMGVTVVDYQGILNTDPTQGWITEFCTDANHAPHPSTSHAVEHDVAKSCATVIQEQFSNVQIASGVSARGVYGGFQAPEWEVADPGSDVAIGYNAAVASTLAGATAASSDEVVFETVDYLTDSEDSQGGSVSEVPYEGAGPTAEPSLAEAIKAAVRTIEKQRRRRVTRAIIVVASSADQLPSVGALAKQMTRGGIRVIAITSGQNRIALRKLAELTRGAYYEVNPRHRVGKVRDDVMSFVDELRFGPPILKLSTTSTWTRKKKIEIDRGSRRIKFVLTHPKDSGLQLSAQPVGGHPPNPRDPGVTLVADPKQSYQFITVDQPATGDWLVRVQGPLFVPFTLTAYSDNPQVRVGVSGAERSYRLGDTVALHVVVGCPLPVEGLWNPVAKVTSPAGTVRTYRLTPGRAGLHSASFRAEERGSYEIEVRVRNTGSARPAGLAPRAREVFDGRFDIPKFQRARRFRIHVV